MKTQSIYVLLPVLICKIVSYQYFLKIASLISNAPANLGSKSVNVLTKLEKYAPGRAQTRCEFIEIIFSQFPGVHKTALTKSLKTHQQVLKVKTEKVNSNEKMSYTTYHPHKNYLLNRPKVSLQLVRRSKE